jgi:hypothetical protein
MRTKTASISPVVEAVRTSIVAAAVAHSRKPSIQSVIEPE